MTLSELIIRYRDNHELSQRQFAVRCGLSNGYISMIERNSNPSTGKPLVPTLSALAKISRGMGLSLDELFSSVEDMPVSLLSSSHGEKPAPRFESELDAELIRLLQQLAPEEEQKVLAFVQGLIANRRA